MMRHSVHAVKPAAKRLAIYLVVASVCATAGLYWVTDGFSKRVTWEDVRPWLDSQ